MKPDTPRGRAALRAQCCLARVNWERGHLLCLPKKLENIGQRSNEGKTKRKEEDEVGQSKRTLIQTTTVRTATDARGVLKKYAI